MFVCKNCGGNIRFDIKSQKLVCGICNSSFEPEEIQKENDSVDYDFFEATIFTCPQCGAAIMCEDNEAASFCTYCASSTVLTSRISKEKKPDYIIPFKKTKKECIEEFRKITKKAIFAPSQLRDAKVLEQFKAIYIPYWYFNVKQEALFTVNGMEEYKDYTSSMKGLNYYNVSGYVEGEYDGICRDGSYDFADDLGERIAPYFTAEKKKFYPSYLSGFYADTTDIPAKVYEHEAAEIANDIARDVLAGEAARGDYKDMKVYLSNDEATKQFNTQVTAKRALLPVWFMSFRKKDKVAYMTVNGQTGAAATDFPISIVKYLIGVLAATILLTVPVTFIMMMFRYDAAKLFQDVTLFISMLSFIIYFIEIKRLQTKDLHSEDAGKFYQKYKVVYIKDKKKNVELKNFIRSNILDLSASTVQVFILIFYILFIAGIFSPDANGILLRIGMSIGNLFMAGVCAYRSFGFKKSSRFVGLITGSLAVVIVLAIQIVDPVSVFGNMLGGTLLALGCFVMFIDLVLYHNELTMRKPSLLRRRGGDEIADSVDL